MTTEIDVILQLVEPASVSSDVLEQHMYEILDAVETHASDDALGAVVAVNYEERCVELAFTVGVISNAEVHEKIARVLTVIETHTAARFAGTASRTAAERGVPVCA